MGGVKGGDIQFEFDYEGEDGCSWGGGVRRGRARRNSHPLKKLGLFLVIQLQIHFTDRDASTVTTV